MKALVVIFALACVVPYAHAAPRTESVGTQFGGARAESATQDTTEVGAAKYWGLTVDEYRRYRQLMRGVRGSFSDSRITPLEVLGIHATTEAERRKYAEAFARLMKEDFERIQAFDREYRVAFHRLYPTAVAVDLGDQVPRAPGLNATLAEAPAISPKGVIQQGAASAKGAMSQPLPIAAGDRVLLFTGSNCQRCASTYKKLAAHAQSGVSLDIYVVGAKQPEDLHRFARELRVDPGLVQAGRITLNYDNGTMAKVLPQQNSVPQVVRKRGESVTHLPVAALQ